MKRICLLYVIILLFMTGCWDQDLLKDARLIYGGGFDLAPNGKLQSTLVIRDVPAGEQQSPQNDIIVTVGNTPRETRDYADDRVSRNLRAYKNRFILIGEELAKQDIYRILEVFYRDPKSALNARIAVAKGKAADILSRKKVGNVLIAEEIDELIKSKEGSTTVPKVTLEKIYPSMLDPGEDFVLPYLVEEGGRVVVSRIAMFHDHQFTGLLSSDESSMYIFLKGMKGKLARFTKKVNVGNSDSYLTYNVEKSKRKMKVLIQKDGKITVQLNLKWKVSIVEYPEDRLEEKQVIEQLNKSISKEMTELAKETIKKMQKARCDGLGIGRQLSAFHHRIWQSQKEDWGGNYQKVKFVPMIQVEITRKGIIN